MYLSEPLYGMHTGREGNLSGAEPLEPYHRIESLPGELWMGTPSVHNCSSLTIKRKSGMMMAQLTVE